MVSIDGIFKAFHDQSEMYKIFFQIDLEEFFFDPCVMIHKTINTYYLNKSYNSFNFIVKL